MGLHVDEFAAFLACAEHYYAVNKGEECVVFAHTHVKTGVVRCATLTFNDVACFAVGTTKNFDAKSFAF